MDEENKDIQGTPETEPEMQEDLQEKVNRDIEQKVSEAAEEVQEEIDEANASAEEAEVAEESETAAEEEVQIPVLPEVVYDVEGNPTEPMFDEEGKLLVPVYDEEGNEIQFMIPDVPEPVKEPKRVNLKVSTVVLSCIGAAIAGALILLLCLQIPKWIATMPEGSTVATVDSKSVTDLDMKFYLYEAASQYVQKNGGVGVAKASEFDWSMPDKENAGKTAEDVVRENAIKTAIDEAVAMGAYEKYNPDFKAADMDQKAQAQLDQLATQLNNDENLMLLNCKRQGLFTTKQYVRKVSQAMEMQAFEEDLEANPDKYYPEDKSSLKQYLSDDAATVDVIIVPKEKDGEESAQPKAEGVLARIQGGESFEDVGNSVASDGGQFLPAVALSKGTTGLDELENTMVTMDVDSVSNLIVTEQGYFILHRVVGASELRNYWKANAKTSIKENAIKKLNLKEILAEQESASEQFKEEYSKINANKAK